MVGPVVEELANDNEGKAVVGKVNVDHNSSGEPTLRHPQHPDHPVLGERRSRGQERGCRAQERASGEARRLDVILNKT